MSINCRIDIDDKVFAPNGKLSLLYKDLEERFGKEKALELYYLTETEEYKDVVPPFKGSNIRLTSEIPILDVIKGGSVLLEEYKGMFSKTTTGVTFYDDLLLDNVQGKRGYHFFYKKQKAKIVMMSPDKYLKIVRDNFNTDVDENILESSKNRIREGIIDNNKIDMPYLSYINNSFAQEGRNRASVAKERGEKLIPVLIAEDVSTFDLNAISEDMLDILTEKFKFDDNNTLMKALALEYNLHRDAVNYINNNVIVNYYYHSENNKNYFEELSKKINYNSIVNVDVNGEMNLNSFLKFVYRSEKQNNFSFETIDFHLKVSQEDLKNLNKIFKDGVFNPSYDNLTSTKVFTEDEVYEIIYSEEKQNNLKQFIEELEISVDTPMVKDFVNTNNVYNSIGLNKVDDPEIIKKEVLSILSDAKTKKEVDTIIKNIPYQSIINKYNSDIVFRENLIKAALNSKKVSIKKDIDQTLDTLLNTLDMAALDEIEYSVLRIENIQDKDLILEEFENLQDNFLDAGFEINIEEYELSTKSVKEIKIFVTALQNLISNPSIESTSKFALALGTFINNNNNTELIDISKLKLDTTNLIYIDSKQNEITNFEEKSIIKVANNLFLKVKDDYNLDQLYDALYSKVVSNPSIIPSNTLVSVIEDNKVSNKMLRAKVNKEFILEDIKGYVQSKTDTLPRANMEVKEKIILYKTFYEISIDYPQSRVSYNKVVNEDYIKNNFISDFNKEILKNKKEGNRLYNYFYKFFKVDHKGIRPINSSTYTESYIKAGLEQIPEKLKNNLIDYSNLSKFFNLNLSPVISDIVVEERIKVQQNPYLAPKIKGNYQVIEEDEILTNTEVEQFVRLEDVVYERVLEFNNTALYKSLPKGDDIFKSTNTDKPVTEKTVEFLRENQIEVEYNVDKSNYVSTKELEEINKENFDCQL